MKITDRSLQITSGETIPWDSVDRVQQRGSNLTLVRKKGNIALSNLSLGQIDSIYRAYEHYLRELKAR